MIPGWVAQYTGLPFSIYNCWQLTCKVYIEQLGIQLPDFKGKYTDSLDAVRIKKLYEQQMDHNWHRIQAPAVFDCVVLRIKGQPWHVGIAVSRNQMLHTEYMLESIVERFTSPEWKNRIIGFYRYNG